MFASNFAPTEPQQPPQHDQSLLVILRAHRVTAAAAAMKKFVSNFAQHKRCRSPKRREEGIPYLMPFVRMFAALGSRTMRTMTLH